MKKSVFKSILRGVALLLVLAMIPLALLSCATPDDDDDKSKKDIEQTDPAKEKQLAEAKAFIEAGDYAAAYEIFEALGDYKGADKELKKFRFMPTKVTYKEIDNGDVDSLETYIVSYGKNGLPQKLTETDNDGDKRVTEYVYDENGNRTKETVTEPNGDKITSEYTYDKDNNLIKKVHTDKNGNTSTYEYTFDDKGNSVKSVYLRGDYKIVTEHTYDENGNCTGSVNKQYRGETLVDTNTYAYTYDENGNLIEDVRTSDRGTETYTMTYDERGNCITVSSYDSYYGGYSTYAEYTYDEKDNCILQVRTLTNGETMIITYTYDENGNLIREVKGDNDIYEYTYDEHENLIKYENKWENDSESVEAEYKLVYIPTEMTDEEYEALIFEFVEY